MAANNLTNKKQKKTVWDDCETENESLRAHTLVIWAILSSTPKRAKLAKVTNLLHMHIGITRMCSL